MASNVALNVVIALSALLALCVGEPQAAPRAKGPHGDALARAARKIRTWQTPDGAITMGKVGPETRIIPYFSNFAALGLVAAYRETDDPKDLEAARHWADFYRAHMRENGVVHDLKGANGAWTDTGDADSTDSYPATYLSLLDALPPTKGDAWLKARYASVKSAVAAMRITLQPNGLTLAKPSWPVMYTMDNVEVWRGLLAASRLARRAGDKASAEEWSAMAKRTEKAIAGELWDDARSAYLVGIQPDGGRMEGLSKWYPDVMANLMAIGWGPASPRHAALYERLRKEFGANLPDPARSEDDLDALVWWGIAANGVNDAPRARAIANRLGAVDLDRLDLSNPGLLGHICLLLAADARRIR